MKNNKAPDPGGLPIKFIEPSPGLKLESLAVLRIQCIQGKDLPLKWNSAFISSAPKKRQEKM